MITGPLEGGFSYILTSVPQIPPTSIFSRALSCGISGMGKSRISVLLGPTLTAARTLSNVASSKENSLCGSDRTGAFDLPPGAHILDVGTNRVEGNLSHIGIVLAVRIQIPRRIADCGVSHAHAPVQPRPPSESSQHWNRNRGRDRGARHRPGVGEVEQRSTRVFH